MPEETPRSSDNETPGFEITEPDGWRPELDPTTGDRAHQARTVLSDAMEVAGVVVEIIRAPQHPPADAA